MRLILLLAVALSAYSEERLTQLTMRDGRVLVGVYDAEHHKLTVDGIEFQVPPGQIAEIGPGEREKKEKRPKPEKVDPPIKAEPQSGDNVTLTLTELIDRADEIEKGKESNAWQKAQELRQAFWQSWRAGANLGSIAGSGEDIETINHWLERLRAMKQIDGHPGRYEGGFKDLMTLHDSHGYNEYMRQRGEPKAMVKLP